MWYYICNNQQVGPLDDNIIHSLIRKGTIIRNTPVWKEGMPEWCHAGTTELQAQFRSIPPVPPSFSNVRVHSSLVSSYSAQTFRSLWRWFAWLVGAGMSVFFLCLGMLFAVNGSAVVYVLMILALAIASLIAGAVLGYILLYRFWSVIQFGTARTSPGKAVGFCFIPFFNFYWFYVAIVGLAKDMNVYCDERNVDGARISEGLALVWFILWLTTLIPFLGLLIELAVATIGIILYKQFVDIAAQIMEARL
jgi:hypothetical protein